MKYKLNLCRNQSGFLLIEVLVSLLIFSVGVLGLVAIQVTAVKASYYSEDRMRASMMANELVSLVMTQKDANKNWKVNPLGLDPAKIVAWKVRLVNTGASGLPAAKADISAPDSNGVVTITITWLEPTLTNSSQFITQVAQPS